MKRILFLLTIIGMTSLVSCGAQENCRGRVSNENMIKSVQTKSLVFNDNHFSKK
jgi:hypothetical protein